MKTARKHSIPTEYKGRMYRSKLEANWAEFFDDYQMFVAHECEGFTLDGFWYLPDFWLPEIKTAVEVKGMLDDTDYEKLSRFTRLGARHALTVILAEAPVGKKYRICRPTPQVYFLNPYTEPPSGRGLSHFCNPDDDTFEYDSRVQLHKCAYCGKVFFCDKLNWFACTACGRSDGDHHLLDIDEPWDIWTPRPSDVIMEDDEVWQA